MTDRLPLSCRLLGHKMAPIESEQMTTMAEAEVTYHDGSTQLVDTTVAWFADEQCARCGRKNCLDCGKLCDVIIWLDVPDSDYGFPQRMGPLVGARLLEILAVPGKPLPDTPISALPASTTNSSNPSSSDRSASEGEAAE